MDCVLAYDVGTSGTKAVLVTMDGRVLGRAFEAYPTYYPKPLWAEQDPDDWWRAMAATTGRVLNMGGARPGEVQGISFSTQMVNVIPVDSGARPLTRCISWLDGRAGEEARHIMRRLGGPAIFAAVVGTAITGKDLVAKYLWLKRNDADTYARASAFVDASGFIIHKATGRLVYEWGAASVTGLFNLKTKVWDTGLMRFLGCAPSKFPDLVPSCERVGRLTAEAAADLGLIQGIPVFAGSGDAQAGAVGAGAVTDGAGHLNLGTSGFVNIITSRRVTGKKGIATLQSADPSRLILISETETCGACLKWAAQQLYGHTPGNEEYGQLDADVAATAPGAGKLIFTPWMYGERSPIADECVRASFINLGSDHTRAQMTRSIYEGVAYNLRWMLETVSDLYGFRPDPLWVTGGGARGRPWLQIIADVTGRSLESVANPQEASAVGAALIAMVGLGVYPSLEATKAAVKSETLVTPSGAWRPLYDQLFSAFCSIYGSLRRLHHSLNRPDAESLG